jgi:hypothetical protein
MADRVPGGLRSLAEADPLAVDDGVPLLAQPPERPGEPVERLRRVGDGQRSLKRVARARPVTAGERLEALHDDVHIYERAAHACPSTNGSRRLESRPFEPVAHGRRAHGELVSSDSTLAHSSQTYLGSCWHAPRMTDQPSSQERQPGGIHIVRRSDFRIRDFRITLDATTGELVDSSMVTELRTDIFDHWLRIAEHASDGSEAARKLAVDARSADAEKFAEALQREFEESMIAITASAVAIDAFFASVVEHAPASACHGQEP